MLTEPVFSIVIPTYHNPELFRRAVDSCLKQENVSFEVIVSDDSSSDVIERSVGELQSERIRYIRRSIKDNAVGNWNFGLNSARGKYVILLHHDEMFFSDHHLSCCLERFEQGADVVFAPIEVKFPDGRCRSMKIPSWMRKFQIRHYPATLLEFNFIGPVACVAFRREKLELFDPELRWVVDVEWYYRLLSRSSRVEFIPDKIVSLHGHASQISGNINIAREKQKDLLLIGQKYQRLFSFRLLLLFVKCWTPLRRKMKSVLSKLIWQSK